MQFNKYIHTYIHTYYTHIYPSVAPDQTDRDLRSGCRYVCRGICIPPNEQRGGGEPLFSTPCCNTSRATWSTPSEPPHWKPFYEGLWFSALVQAAVVNLFVLNLVCFIPFTPVYPKRAGWRTRILEKSYCCCGFGLGPGWLLLSTCLF